MSGIASNCTTPRYYGPRAFSTFDLRGIRFVNDNEPNGGGAGFQPVTINTQAEMDELFKDRVARAEKPYEALKGLDIAAVVARYNATKDLDLANITAQAAELATLKANQGADVTELTTKLSAAEARATEAEAKVTAESTARIAAENKSLRYDIAATTGLPLTHAARLVGATKEELEADALEFKKTLRTDGYDPGQGHQDGEPQLGAQGSAEADRRFGKPENT